MANRITSVFDFKSSGLNKVKQDIAGVDGAWNKARVGFKSSISEFRASTGAQAAAVGALAIGASKAVNAATTLEESVNAVTVTYGENAEAVLAIGENAATSFGMSKSAFNAFAVRFSSFAHQIAEKDGRDVAEVLEEITTRVADFASVNDLDMARAAEVFQSTMAGSAEVARQYGVDVSAASVQTYLLNEGLVESKGAITEADKVLGRYAVLMEGTAKTAGDFEATSDSLANQQRILSAQTEDLAAAMGDTLVPVLTTVVGGLNEIINLADAIGFDDLTGFIGELDTKSYDLGRSIRGAFDDAAAANHELVDSTQKAVEWAGQFDLSILRNQESMKTVREEALAMAQVYLGDVPAAYRAANEIALRWNDTVKVERDALELKQEAHANALGTLEWELDVLRDSSDAHADLTAEVYDQAEAMEAAEQATADAEREMNGLYAAIGRLISTLSADAELEALSEKLTEASSNAEMTELDIANLRLEVATFGDQVAGLPPSVLTEIDAMIDEGQYWAAEERLRTLTRARFAPIQPLVTGGTGQVGPHHAGTSHAGGGMALIGEFGPELVRLPRGAQVDDHAKTARQMTAAPAAGVPLIGSLTVNAGMGADGRRIGDEILRTIEQALRTGSAVPPTLKRRLS